MLTFISGQSDRQATIDLTLAYAQYGATKLERTFFLNGSGSSSTVELRDVIQTKGSLPMEWTMNTRANISLSPDGLTATLQSEDVIIRGRLSAPAGVVFSTAKVNPAPPNEKINGVTRLMVNLTEEQSKDAVLSVVFSAATVHV